MTKRKTLIHLHGNTPFNAPDSIVKGELVIEHGSGTKNVKMHTKSGDDQLATFITETAIDDKITVAEAAIDAKWAAADAQVLTDAQDYADVLNTAMNTRVDTLEGLTSTPVVPIVYSELKVLRDNSNLIPGHLYRITDYITTTTQVDTQSAGHPFDVIVLALGKSTLSERAWVIRSERDTDGYFLSSKLEAWQIWYCLDNDSNRFTWADATNGKGVIYRLIDEWGNDCPYDFYNILFRGWKESDNNYLDENAYYYTFAYISQPNVNALLGVGLSAINHVKISASKTMELSSPLTLLRNILDVVLTDHFFKDISIGSRSSNIYIRSSARNTKIGYGCTNITILGACGNVNIGDVCTNIILGNEYTNVSIGNFCSRVGVVKDEEVPVPFVTNLKIGDKVTNLLLYNTETASSNNEVRNIEIKDGVNLDGGLFVMSVVRNQSANYTIAVTTEGVIKRFNVADL